MPAQDFCDCDNIMGYGFFAQDSHFCCLHCQKILKCEGCGQPATRAIFKDYTWRGVVCDGKNMIEEQGNDFCRIWI